MCTGYETLKARVIKDCENTATVSMRTDAISIIFMAA